MGHRIHFLALLSLSLFLVGCDLTTKELAVRLLKNRPPLELFAYLDLRYGENHDVAFHLMAWISPSIRHYVILTVATFSSTLLLTFFVLWGRRHRYIGLGLISILSGAAGNTIDRHLHGFVVDWIHIHIDNFSWPVFNVADICVTTGIIILALTLPRVLFSLPTHLVFPPPPLPPHKPFLPPFSSPNPSPPPPPS